MFVKNAPIMNENNMYFTKEVSEDIPFICGFPTWFVKALVDKHLRLFPSFWITGVLLYPKCGCKERDVKKFWT